MKKAAFFVEGQTEQIFLKKLIEEIGGTRNITFVEEKLSGRTFTSLREVVPHGAQKLALIVDCSSDSRVRSAISERRQGLIANGFTQIVGLRDLHPEPLHSLPDLKRGLYYRLTQAGAKTDIVVAVQEIETWFLAERSHFSLIDPILTHNFVHNGCPNASVRPLESIQNPASVLHDVYSLAGKAYNKRRKNVARTVENIDYGELYFNIRNQSHSLDELISLVELFLF